MGILERAHDFTFNCGEFAAIGDRAKRDSLLGLILMRAVASFTGTLFFLKRSIRSCASKSLQCYVRAGLAFMPVTNLVSMSGTPSKPSTSGATWR